MVQASSVGVWGLRVGVMRLAQSVSGIAYV